MKSGPRTADALKQWRGRATTVAALLLLLGGSAYLLLPHIAAHRQRAAGARVNADHLRAAEVAVTVQPKLQLKNPVSIQVPRLGIEKTIVLGGYSRQGKWKLDNTHAFFADQAATPLIYGHNTAQVFKGLSGVAADELLVVTEVDGQAHTFSYVRDEILKPADSAVLEQHYPDRLLVMTCSGQWSQHRRLLYFAYVGTQPSALIEHKVGWQ